ncbi:hypothetical protein ABI59_20345 [Acidobacteria bacterium Mor1]|nr:hypothetical protein ABI59_20345 [Acidobacteria bacterium Mor1]
MKIAVSNRDGLDKLVQAVVRGEMRLHALPKYLSAAERAEIRRQFLEEISGETLKHVGTHSLDTERASGRHCENFVGVAQIPLGVTGPLRVRGRDRDQSIYVPLATTEGALLASINRGCSAIRAAGGVVSRVEDVGMTRAPVFRTGGIAESEDFVTWVEANHDRIREVAEGTSRFCKLKEIRPTIMGSTVYLRFRFATGDAMGMNMATIACDRVVRNLIYPETGIECVALSGNQCVDKKPAAINFLEGRGKRIHCEVRLSAEVLRKNLKVNRDAFVDMQYRKNLLGSIAAGALGFNAHYANIVAAFFIATGQDVAHVGEGSMGVTMIEPIEDGGALFSIMMPDVPLGTVGGGTALDTQREALSLLDVDPDPAQPGAATMRLAEILGGIVLAGELSLLAAITSGDLTSAHERLARGVDTDKQGPRP